MVLLGISFIAGVLTVLAPCILPLLPVIIGGSVDETGRGIRKVLTIVVSLGLSVILFTYILKASSALIEVPPSVWMYLSGGIVLLFGLSLVFPVLWEKIPFLAKASIGSNRLLTAGYKQNSFWGDVIIGAALGPVFSTCSPTYFVVLATVLPENFLLGTAYLLAYTLGLCLSLFLIGIIGQSLADKLGLVADPRSTFKKVLGVLFIIVGIVIITGYDRKIQAQLLMWGIFDITTIEQKLLQMNDPDAQGVPHVAVPTIFDEATRVAQKERLFDRAPEIQKPAGFINTGTNADGTAKPITIAELKGKKVILLDIWTYSCINCQRTIPYLNAWYDKYRDQGLEIIGLHTPEFAFERDIENVEWAVSQFKLKYPQVLDNDYATWRELGNNYWPRKYLIDIDGFIVYDHIGEGSYEETEAAIQRALMERAMVVGGETPDATIVAETIPEYERERGLSSEIYFGAFRNEALGNGTPGQTGVKTYTLPENRIPNVLYLSGTWDTSSESAKTTGPARIFFTYRARDVYMVASAPGIKATIFRDGIPVGEFAGEDVDPKTSTVEFKENRLYKLIQENEVGIHTIEIRIEEPGFDAYTFTFG